MLLSLHVTGVYTQPLAALQLSVVHMLLSLHVTGVYTQPLVGSQLSVVHMLLSLHVIGANTHPVAGLHVSVVHRLRSLHVIGVYVQPFVGSHVSVVHALLSLQTSAVPGTHTLFAHVSTPLHGLPSSHCCAVVHASGGPSGAASTSEPSTPASSRATPCGEPSHAITANATTNAKILIADHCLTFPSSASGSRGICEAVAPTAPPTTVIRWLQFVLRRSQ